MKRSALGLMIFAASVGLLWTQVVAVDNPFTFTVVKCFDHKCYLEIVSNQVFDWLTVDGIPASSADGIHWSVTFLHKEQSIIEAGNAQLMYRVVIIMHCDTESVEIVSVSVKRLIVGNIP